MSKKSYSALDIIERKIKPLLPNKFCIAFSGGIDSMVLLHAMKNIIDEKSQIRAIHINCMKMSIYYQLIIKKTKWKQFF